MYGLFLQGSVAENTESILFEAENKDLFQNALKLAEILLFPGRWNRYTLPYSSC